MAMVNTVTFAILSFGVSRPPSAIDDDLDGTSK